MELEVTAVDPPLLLRQTYAEGVTAVDYLLTESEGQTHVIPT